MQQINYIQIYGERNSGTNYLASLLKKNVLNCPEIGFKYGWKHGFIKEKELKKGHLEEVLFILIFKDPYAWISSMHEKPHHAPQLYNMDFTNFIRSEWACYFGKNYRQRAETLAINPLDPKDEIFIERHPVTKDRIENVVHLRNEKNKSFLSLDSRVPNVKYLRYEDLYVEPVNVLTEILYEYNISVEEKFENSTGYLGKNPKVTWERKQYYDDKKFLDKYSLEDLNFVNSILDFELEKKIGYESVKLLV